MDQWSVIRVRTPLEISFMLSLCGLSLGARHFRFTYRNIFHLILFFIIFLLFFFFFLFFLTNIILYYSHVIVCLWNTWINLNTVCNVLCQITCMPFMYLNKYYYYYYYYYYYSIIESFFRPQYAGNICCWTLSNQQFNQSIFHFYL